MRAIGLIVAILGAAGFLAVVFLMPTSVNTESFGGGAVTNLALQQQQMLAAIGTVALFLAGIILHAAGALIPRAGVDTLVEDEATMAQLGITREANGYRWGGGIYPTFAAAARDARHAS